MKTRRVVNWTKRSKTRLRVRQDWIERESGYHDIAVNWAMQVNESVAQLADFPKIGRVVPEIQRDDIREIIVAKTTRVIYKVREHSCDILTVRRCYEQITGIRSL